MTLRIVLVGLTLEDVSPVGPLHDVARETGADLAFLQGDGPSLTSTLDRLVQTTTAETTIRLVPATLAAGGAPRSWVARVAGHWVRTRGTRRVEVTHRTVHEPSANAVREAAAGGHRDVTGDEPPLENPAWETTPPFTHHLLVCRGPRCNAKGAEEVSAAVSASLRRHGLMDSVVLMAQTGCLFPCNQAPVVVCHPGGTWYHRVNPSDVDRIVVEDLMP